MDRQQIVRELIDGCAIAVVRARDTSLVERTAQALLEGGVRILEITMTVPGAIDLIRRCEKLPGVLVGAGTVLTADDVTRCADAGARFIVSPALCPEVIEATGALDLVSMPGAMTPTEVLNGWRAGADFVKVFPASRLGPAFLSDLLAPFPDVRLAPTGGLTDQNATDYLQAGASVLGFGSWLVNQTAMEVGDFAQITESARRLHQRITRFREAPHG